MQMCESYCIDKKYFNLLRTVGWSVSALAFGVYDEGITNVPNKNKNP